MNSINHPESIQVIVGLVLDLEIIDSVVNLLANLRGDDDVWDRWQQVGQTLEQRKQFGFQQ